MGRTNYTPDDIKRMQQDAVRRVRDMQTRAKMMAGDMNTPLESQDYKIKNQSAKLYPKNHLQNNKNSNAKLNSDGRDNNRSNFKPEERVKEPIPLPINQINGIKNLLKIFFKDQEKTLIIVLIMLLVNENQDPGIILALMYTMM